MTDDIPKLRFKVRIDRKLKDTRQVRLIWFSLQTRCMVAFGDSQLAGHPAASPSRLALRRPGGLIGRSGARPPC
jgi:hypothetical protein